MQSVVSLGGGRTPTPPPPLNPPLVRQCLWYCHRDQIIVRVHPVHLMSVGQRQTADDPQTEPPYLGCESACISCYHLCPPLLLLLLLSPKTDTHFTEGRRLSQPRQTGCEKVEKSFYADVTRSGLGSRSRVPK